VGPAAGIAAPLHIPTKEGQEPHRPAEVPGTVYLEGVAATFRSTRTRRKTFACGSKREKGLRNIAADSGYVDEEGYLSLTHGSPPRPHPHRRESTVYPSW